MLEVQQFLQTQFNSLSYLAEEVVNATPWSLYPRERDTVHIAQEVGWASGPVWTVAKNLTPHQDPIPVASRYTD